MANVKKGVSFTLVIWIVVALFVFYNTCLPIVESIWAGYMWDKVPCQYPFRTSGFLFEYQGEKYYSIRLDFWDRERVNSTKAADTDEQMAVDRICYVKHNDPNWAVLNVDIFNHLDHARGLAGAVMVIVAGVLLTVGLRKFSHPPAATK